MTTQSAIDLLEPATAFRLAGKYARQAQQYLAHGDLQQAYIACLDGHFVCAEGGDESFLPVRLWLQDKLAVKSTEAIIGIMNPASQIKL